MRLKFTLIVLMALYSLATQAQDISGSWHGMLKVQGMQLRLVFNIKADGNGYTATMDSPDQGVNGIPVSETRLENGRLSLAIPQASITYSGEVKGNTVEGQFKQGGFELPLILSRDIPEKEVLRRPQDPVEPLPYRIEEIRFENREAGITLAGTLTLPEGTGKFPAVVLISGSGPQNRDEELLGHRPFLVLADHLTRQGIAVLRFDDRGVGESTGDFNAATSADFATDAASALAYLKTRKEINRKKTGLIGHSEGGMIAPMVAAQDKSVAFLVLLAGPGIPIDSLLFIQQDLISRASGLPEETMRQNREINQKLFRTIQETDDVAAAEKAVRRILQEAADSPEGVTLPPGMTKEEFIDQQTAQVISPWMRYFLRYQPAEALRQVRCPVLAINGEKDLQVTPKENLAGIRQALSEGKNRNVTIKELPGLNHLFQTSETGSPMEYGAIEETFSPTALTIISEWIRELSK
jgi:pimeloyl-ACP methyl ester carboxylesterase